MDSVWKHYTWLMTKVKYLHSNLDYCAWMCLFLLFPPRLQRILKCGILCWILNNVIHEMMVRWYLKSFRTWILLSFVFICCWISGRGLTAHRRPREDGAHHDVNGSRQVRFGTSKKWWSSCLFATLQWLISLMTDFGVWCFLFWHVFNSWSVCVSVTTPAPIGFTPLCIIISYYSLPLKVVKTTWYVDVLYLSKMFVFRFY